MPLPINAMLSQRRNGGMTLVATAQRKKEARLKAKQAAAKKREEMRREKLHARLVADFAEREGIILDKEGKIVSWNGLTDAATKQRALIYLKERFGHRTFMGNVIESTVDQAFDPHYRQALAREAERTEPKKVRVKRVKREETAAKPVDPNLVWPPRPKKEPVDLEKYVVPEGGTDTETAEALSLTEPSALTVLSDLLRDVLEESKKDPSKKKITLHHLQCTDVNGMYRLAGEPVPTVDVKGDVEGVEYVREGPGTNERVIRSDLAVIPVEGVTEGDGENSGEKPDTPMGELLWEEVESLEGQVRHWRSEYEEAQKELHEAHTARRRTEELLLAGKREEEWCSQETALTLARLVVNPNLRVTPVEALRTAAQLFANRIVVLPAAYESAEKVDRNFKRGGKLLKLLLKLGTDYYDVLTEKGDAEARKVFSPSEYSACESDTVRSGGLGRLRDFVYNGESVRMEQHLKIGIAADTSVTLRCYFAWIAEERKFVVGYCGEHLPVASHRT